MFLLEWKNELSTDQNITTQLCNWSNNLQAYKTGTIPWMWRCSKMWKLQVAKNAWCLQFVKIWCSKFCMLYSTLANWLNICHKGWKWLKYYFLKSSGCFPYQNKTLLLWISSSTGKATDQFLPPLQRKPLFFPHLKSQHAQIWLAVPSRFDVWLYSTRMKHHHH